MSSQCGAMRCSFPNRATMPSPTKRLNVIAMEKSMYPSPSCGAETRCSPTSKSALQSSRAPSTKNEIAARSAAISKISQCNTHAIRTDCTLLREAPPRGGIGECNRYGQRLGAGYPDVFANLMIGGAILPSLLHQDPRLQGTLATGCLDITPFLDFDGSGRRLWPRRQSRVTIHGIKGGEGDSLK
jgi:hypothetical protein